MQDLKKTFKYAKLSFNTKESIGKFNKPFGFNKIDTTKNNIGLFCRANNLFLVDIDKKNNGIEEWNEYLKTNEEPNTTKQTTPNDGIHYIFKETDPAYTPEQNILIGLLKSKNNYRTKDKNNKIGIDVKKGEAYLVFEGSKINGKYYKIVNDIAPQLIPLNLLKWLLFYETTKTTAQNNNIILMKDEKQLKTLLNEFKNVSNTEWKYITIGIKNLLHDFNNLNENKVFKIWDEWSKTEKGYDKDKNYKIWKTNKSTLNLNYFINILNSRRKSNQKIERLESFKQLEEATTQNDMITIDMNNKFIYDENYKEKQITQEIFNTYDTIIIKSTTGTGKTSNISKFTAEYMKDKPHIKFLSLVNLITLANQHISNFQNINLKSYQDKNNINLDEDNLVICLNSLLKFNNYNTSFLTGYIVYIDEINSFISSLTHNPIIYNILKPLISILFRIINNAHKVIISDAVINDNCFKFVSKRKNKVFINNSFKKYENIPFYKINDENIFLEKMTEKVKNKEYFLMASDSKETVTHYFNECDSEDKILITSDNPFKITDATTQFKNKYVFYSPSITTGIDFTINTIQDVLIYIKGNTLTPEASFQQMTRTRNIKSVYCFISEIESKTAIYKSLIETEDHLKKVETIHKALNYMEYQQTEDGDEIINNDIFFNLYCFNEYQIDTFNTNKKIHFLNIVKNNGFIIEEIGQIIKLDKVKKKEMKDKLTEQKEIIFTNHYKEIEENQQIKHACNRFKINIKDEEHRAKYGDIVTDVFKQDSTANLLKLFLSDETLKFMKDKQNINIPAYIGIKTSVNKIELISKLEKELNIERFNLTKKEIDEPKIIDKKLIDAINVAFRSPNQEPKTFNDCIDYYQKKLSHLLDKIKLIETERKRSKIEKKKISQYNINIDELTKYLKLIELRNPTRRHLIKNSLFYKNTDIEIIGSTEEKCEFIDDAEKEADIDDVLEIIKITEEAKPEYFFDIIINGSWEWQATDDQLKKIVGWDNETIKYWNLYKLEHIK